MAKATIRKTFGDRVRKLRSDKGYSQETFADVTGLHRTYIGAIERGEQNVSIDNVERIAKALKLSLQDLFKGL